ncbi:xanthine dehydrogenase family protein molybdopterin-binding subunit [Algoriphagus zhangzhouensis]|uniref:Isoquinoline 1-oxidoreductase, beta subunit n=1 Tax=Algoriphagus zhangzhouensis TaxID=1073327 RepID=A0A1M7Z794_9BACT|nr:molybdopterin cofactor-binding domain-containing protein [Algoriphagus zhangzhouensis]TDY49324.1 isoquinoline 1-oxidoreductase beta subunit [Algoriphagus zhangzhouensis]SHO60771.1 isoquinoline 1-oxidoreductase, beta subunit [Algoriphagus zhangzhouensis]
MTTVNTKINRRSFLKVSALAGGGMVLSFSWLAGCKPTAKEMLAMPKEWFELNSYIKIGDNGLITIYSPNPEFGSNVKTSMPMLVAEELDVDWKNVMVEQADFYPERFDRQFTGGSQGIRQGWKPLRTAGATAKAMLVAAAAQTWNVPASEITTSNGEITHAGSGKKAGYGEMASLAATLEVPEEVELKEIKDFKIIGNSKKNVDGQKIVTGKPMYALDKKVEGMKYAAIVHPPAFGMKLKSFDKESISGMPGIMDVFSINIFKDDYARNFFDTTTFPEIVAIVGNSTWEVMQAKKNLKAEWEEAPKSEFMAAGFGGNATEVTVPAGLENTSSHKARMAEYIQKPGNILRRDGDPEGQFKKAHKVIERTYSAPFLAHNTMEPMNAFAHVQGDKAEIYGPTQAPEMIRGTIEQALGIPKENIQINLARMGGGFGRRAYSHHLVEAALISQKIQAPVKMVYTREDDMSAGVYRPTYSATYRAALDENNKLLAFHVKAGGIPESPIHANRFPAGAIENYLAEGWDLPSNITIGAFRAPRSNFIAGAEQSFLDELAEEMGKDPIEFRLELLKRAEMDPVGENNDYVPSRYAGVLELVREKSNWNSPQANVHRGVSAYFCHNSYVAEVVDTVVKDNKPVVESVYAAVDCGVVVNPDAAANMGEGAIVDGIGNAFFGEMAFENGAPTKTNFDKYRMIRHREAPKKIEVHFVENTEDPTGLGEPLFPPVFAALANSLYKATGKRYYEQPFAPQLEMQNLRM